MGFKTNQQEANQNDYLLKPEGAYEVIIKSVEEKTFKTGTKGLNMKLLIRNDVPEQKYGNAFLFHTFWKRKEPTELDMQVEGYSYGQLMNLSKSAKLPDGKGYESLEQFCTDLIDKCIRVTVQHDDWNDKMYEKITWITETKHPDCRHIYADKNGYANRTQGFAAPQQSYSNVSDIPDDEDLPF